MKLLFDANVSHRLVKPLASEYPGSIHRFETFADESLLFLSIGTRAL